MSLRRVKAIVVRDLKLLFREKTTVFWLFIFPIILLSAYVTLFAPQAPTEKTVAIEVAIVPGSRNESLLDRAREIVKKLERPWNISNSWRIKVKATLLYSLDNGLESLRKGYLDAVVYLPADTLRKRTVNVTIYTLKGTPNLVREQLVTSYLYSFFAYSAQIMATDMLSGFVNRTTSLCPRVATAAHGVLGKAWKIAGSADIRIVDVTPGRGGNVRSRTIGWMTLSVVFISFMFGGIVGGASSITSEIRRGFIHRLLATRLRPSEYFGAMTVSWILALTVSALPVAAIGFWVYGGSLAVKPFSVESVFVSVIILVTMILSFSLGVLIGFAAKTPEAANIIANLFVWATMIAGGFWVPKSMLPGFLRWFACTNVMSVLFYSVVDIAVYGRGVTGGLAPTALAVAASMALFIIASVIYVRYLPRLLESAEMR